MSDVASSPAPAVTPAKRKAKTTKTTKTSKPKVAAAHPETKAMVVAAITALKDRKGASLQAIKKYIAANNKVDIVKLNVHLKRCLKKGVEAKAFEQVKGHGASGRFKLAEKGEKKAAPKAKKPAAKTAKPKSATPKKVKTPKKASAPKKTPKKAAAKPKSPKVVKAKKAVKKVAVKKPAAKKTKKAAPKKA